MQQVKEQTILKSRNKLFNFIKGKVSSIEDAEDILQDVFFQFVDGYGAVNSIEKATSWLFTVARNKIIDRYRKVKVRPKNVSKVAGNSADEGPMMLLDILPDLGDSPEDVYFRSVIWEEIREAMASLPEEQRAVFIMHELEDKSFKDISEMTRIPVNTLISRKRYAVLALRKRLQELYDEI